MKKTKIRISGDSASVVQYCIPATGPRFQRAVIEWPTAASTAISAAKIAQNTAETTSSWSRRVMTTPPDDDDGVGERQTRRHRAPPQVLRVGDAGAEHEEGEDQRHVRRVEQRPVPPTDHVLGQHADRRGRGEHVPPAHAPPVAVLGAGHTQDQRDAVAGEQRARPARRPPGCAGRSAGSRSWPPSAATPGSGRSTGRSRARPDRGPGPTRPRTRRAAVGRAGAAGGTRSPTGVGVARARTAPDPARGRRPPRLLPRRLPSSGPRKYAGL